MLKLYLYVWLYSIRLQEVKQEDRVVLVALYRLQELLGGLPHLVLRRESLLEVGGQLVYVLIVDLHFMTN